MTDYLLIVESYLKEHDPMLMRLGRVIYWASCLFACGLVVFGIALGLDEDFEFFAFALLSIPAYMLGLACLYIFSGEIPTWRRMEKAMSLVAMIGIVSFATTVISNQSDKNTPAWMQDPIVEESLVPEGIGITIEDLDAFESQEQFSLPSEDTSFTPEQQKLLNAVRERLKKKNAQPISNLQDLSDEELDNLEKQLMQGEQSSLPANKKFYLDPPPATVP